MPVVRIKNHQLFKAIINIKKDENGSKYSYKDEEKVGLDTA